MGEGVCTHAEGALCMENGCSGADLQIPYSRAAMQDRSVHMHPIIVIAIPIIIHRLVRLSMRRMRLLLPLPLPLMRLHLR